MTIANIETRIIHALRGGSSVRIAELARQLDVSGETIRRHVRPLVERGVIAKAHGVVRIAPAFSEPPFHRRLQHHAAAKRAIAARVAQCVEDGMTLMIDTGSTTPMLQKRCPCTKNFVSLPMVLKLPGHWLEEMTIASIWQEAN